MQGFVVFLEGARFQLGAIAGAEFCYAELNIWINAW
jgi:hypothetical protein